MSGRHPRFFHVGNLLLITPLCVLGSIIGMQLLVRLGVTTNTALIGAMAGMALGRVPLGALRFYRSIHVQNLAQSAISASTFGAANALLLPIGIPFVLGRMDLVPVMFAGAACAMFLDAVLLYRMFGSEVFPAQGAWPPGIAAAGAIEAGDQGGRKAAVLGAGVGLGVIGSVFGVPMSGFGVAFIGNVFALAAFGLGLLSRAYLPGVLASLRGGFDLGRSHGPEGMMLGAGLAALAQVGWVVIRSSPDPLAGPAEVSAGSLRRTLGGGLAAYLVIAAGIALAGGLQAALSLPMLITFIGYAAVAALLHELIIGLAGMHSGWFPAFAVAVVSLMIGLLIGFPAPALALLVGFTAATGPAFADMGCDLRAGFLLRGQGKDPDFEQDGRRQQLFAALYALAIAACVVLVTYPSYLAHGMVAPVDHAFVAAIRAGSSPELARILALWAVPGALLQLAGGSRRQIGVLFATGLLLHAPAAGWAVLAGILVRTAWLRARGEDGRAAMEVFAAGTIAGDALAGFGGSMLRRLR